MKFLGVKTERHTFRPRSDLGHHRHAVRSIGNKYLTLSSYVPVNVKV